MSEYKFNKFKLAVKQNKYLYNLFIFCCAAAGVVVLIGCLIIWSLALPTLTGI